MGWRSKGGAEQSLWPRRGLRFTISGCEGARAVAINGRCNAYESFLGVGSEHRGRWEPKRTGSRGRSHRGLQKGSVLR